MPASGIKPITTYYIHYSTLAQLLRFIAIEKISY